MIHLSAFFSCIVLFLSTIHLSAAGTSNYDIRVLTFNTHGLPAPLSQNWPERRNALCRELKNGFQDPNGWDVVLLQEVWKKSDHTELSRCGYPYIASLENRSYDSGALILSRYPIAGKTRKVYSVGGDPRFPLDGEILARKSALAAWIIHPAWGRVLIGNTHLVANYEPWGARYETQRKTQFQEFSDFIQKKANGWPTIIGGDWNFGPYGKGYERLWDLFAKYFPGFDSSRYAFGTCTACSSDEGKIDHLFASSQFSAKSGGLALQSKIKMGRQSIELSDHFGWETTFGLR